MTSKDGLVETYDMPECKSVKLLANSFVPLGFGEKGPLGMTNEIKLLEETQVAWRLGPVS